MDIPKNPRSESDQITQPTIKHKPILRIQFALIILSSIIVTVIFLLLRMILDLDISKSYLPLLAYPLNFLLLYIVFYQKAHVPIHADSFRIFTQEIGLKIDKNTWKLVFLGVLLGILSLSGMLLGSILSNNYTFDWAQLELEQVLFATVPGIWEEIFFRGLLMLVFLKIFKKTKKTMIIQSIVFGLLHFQGFHLWEIVDMISVMVIGFAFTYVAYQTNSIIPGMIFHYIHDAFIFLVQVPETTVSTNLDNVYFYLSLWIAQAIICGISYLFQKLVLNSPKKWKYDYNHLLPLIPQKLNKITHMNSDIKQE
ncbi:hypothetical protein NEF87_001776 [Candidatus Lokiarchaeum ossiferum]|uniref:CAAX prenyl protease 2/Lysostaphin resistance protein A-like domain-containing protein n=1 Tax=Candidatus Lokiarchaeum ossiferum TaxID=2951803 RepID=A0ABY6HPN9_9ARCH|nr:hypothetical protein NEF87_001776 [Candidatus Lokiarchaeum sp. B-35]